MFIWRTSTINIHMYPPPPPHLCSQGPEDLAMWVNTKKSGSHRKILIDRLDKVFSLLSFSSWTFLWGPFPYLYLFGEHDSPRSNGEAIDLKEIVGNVATILPAVKESSWLSNGSSHFAGPSYFCIFCIRNTFLYIKHKIHFCIFVHPPRSQRGRDHQMRTHTLQGRHILWNVIPCQGLWILPRWLSLVNNSLRPRISSRF